MTSKALVVQRPPARFRALVGLGKRLPTRSVQADARATMDQLNAIDRLTCGDNPLRCKFGFVREQAREDLRADAGANEGLGELQVVTMLDLAEKGFRPWLTCDERHPLMWFKPNGYLLFVQRDGFCRLLSEDRDIPRYAHQGRPNLGPTWSRVGAANLTVTFNEQEGFSIEPYTGLYGAANQLLEGGAQIIAEDLYLFEHTPANRPETRSPTQTMVAILWRKELIALFHDAASQGRHIERIFDGGFHVVELFEQPIGWTDGSPRELMTRMAMRVTDGSRQAVIWKPSSESDFQFELEG